MKFINNEYKKDGKVKIWARVGMSCWIPEKEYKKLLKEATYEDGLGDVEYNNDDAFTQYMIKNGWADGETYIPSQVFENIEDEE